MLPLNHTQDHGQIIRCYIISLWDCSTKFSKIHTFYIPTRAWNNKISDVLCVTDSANDINGEYIKQPEIWNNHSYWKRPSSSCHGDHYIYACEYEHKGYTFYDWQFREDYNLSSKCLSNSINCDDPRFPSSEDLMTDH